MPQTITFGQALLSDILPPDIYKPGMELNKSGIKRVMSQVADKYPDKYAEIATKLMRVGLKSGEALGGASFGINDLRTPDEVKLEQQRINLKVKQVLDAMPPGKERSDKIRDILMDEASSLQKKVIESGKANKNRFMLQLEGAGRGNAKTLTSMLGGDVVATNSVGEVIPIPLTRGYSQGQTLSQYLASAYEGRAGLVGTKLSVGSSGYLSKLLQQSAHRALVVGEDDEHPIGHDRGYFVDIADTDNIGSLLAKDYGPYKKDTVITPKVLSDIKNHAPTNQILVRSPISSSSLDDGVFAKDVGMREYGRLPMRGEHVGIPSAQAIGEQVTQAALGSKHGSGTKKKKDQPGLAGFPLIERLVSPPKEGFGLAIHTHYDGKINSIREAPQGGYYITVGDNEEQYIPGEFEPTVSVGDTVEAGDVLTNGIPDPAEVTRFKGIGEGRRQFIDAMRRGLSEAGFPVHRRNIELLARGLLNRVEVTDEFDEFLPGSVTSYSRVERLYRPREDSKQLSVAESLGRYLEVPTTHLTIGTRITPKIRKHLEDVGVKNITTNQNPPPFQPRVTRAMDLLQTDDDYMTRFLGSHLQTSLLDSIQTTGESDEMSTSFVPVRASGINLDKSKFTLNPR